MYLFLVIAVYLVFAYYFVDWRNWKDYYPTILYFISLNMLYNFIYYNHTLWAYHAVTLDWLNHTIIDIAFSFIIVPIVLMMYLRYYPNGRKKYIYLAVWIGYFTVIEYLFHVKGLFLYDNGWSTTWSAVFNFLLFTMIRLHYNNPIFAWVLSVPIIVVILFLFPPALADMK